MADAKSVKARSALWRLYEAHMQPVTHPEVAWAHATRDAIAGSGSSHQTQAMRCQLTLPIRLSSP